MVFTSRELLNPTSVSYVLIGEHRSHRLAVYGQGKAGTTITTMAQANQTPTILGALDLNDSEGDSLTGNVEEVLFGVERILRKTPLHHRVKKLRGAFTSWLSDLDSFIPTEQQLRLAEYEAATASQTLSRMVQSATDLVDAQGKPEYRDIVERELSMLDAQMVVLARLFPAASATRRANISSSRGPSTEALSWAASEPGSGNTILPPLQSTNTSPPPRPNYTNSHSGSSFPRPQTRQSTGFSNSGAEARPRPEIWRINSPNSGQFVTGNWYQSPEDAMGDHGPGMLVHEVFIGGTSRGILGNVHGSQNPIGSPLQEPRREEQGGRFG
ncbi:hypothetical protein LTS08_007987 [Lithohypha guttulata]|nr:hypothetical protein LTS08_007987 [Lithohypha guttulata]